MAYRMVSLRSAITVVAAPVLLLLAACAVALASPGKGEVGGPPTVRLGPPDEGTQTSPSLVIGVGSVVDGPVQIVAQGWEGEADSPPADFCVWIEQPPDDIQFGTCGLALERGGRRSVAVDMDVQTVAPKSARATSVGGRISPDVTAVRLYFRRPGSRKRHRVNAIVAQVDGELQRRLGQPAPFGFFYAKVRGLIPFGAFRAQALDASGRVIGTAGR